MAIFVIRDRETGAYLTSSGEEEVYNFRSELTGLTWIYSDPDVARAVVADMPMAADVIELRPFTGQIEAEYLSVYHAIKGHGLPRRAPARGIEPGTDDPMTCHWCDELRARLGL